MRAWLSFSKATRKLSTSNHHLVSNRRSSPSTLRLDTLRRHRKVIVTERCLRSLNGGPSKSVFTCGLLTVDVPGTLAVVRLYCTTDIPGHWS